LDLAEIATIGMADDDPEQLVPGFEIFYILALRDWKPHEVTPFQGFAPGLPDFVPVMEYIPRWPADIIEPAFELNERLARRRAGLGAWFWSPINLDILIEKRSPTVRAPFMVVFSGDKKTARTISAWRSGLRIPPIHVSFVDGCGAINPERLTQNVIQQRLLTLVNRVANLNKGVDVSQHLRALHAWKGVERRTSSLRFHSHNVTKPNEMTLIGAGELPPRDMKGHLNVSPAGDYVQGITESTEAVIALWRVAIDSSDFLPPPPPDLYLLAPSMYRGMPKRFERSIEIPEIKAALRALDRQRGYTMSLTIDDSKDAGGKAHLNKVGPLLVMRGAEMKLTTSAVGLRAAGSVAATLRLPPAVNRGGGVVSELARFIRQHENPPPRKTARVFKAVQDALRNSVPDEHLKLISQSKNGIKIIADAPLEWLPIDGLPLGIRYDVSRINTTPGNVFLNQICSTHPIYIPPSAFRNYRVLSMFDDGDSVAYHLRRGLLNTMDENGHPIIGDFHSPRSIDSFVRSFESFSGPILIIDSHAEHHAGDVPGNLIINGTRLDVWSLAGKIQVPPIVILSACDTHPFDRSHATVGNGFLACGALAVVATSLPIRGLSAARFIMRLINRAVHFGEIMNGTNRPVAWTNIVSGVLRMELATDIIGSFGSQGFYDEARRAELLLQTNMDLNPLRHDWYERLVERVSVACDSERTSFEKSLSDVVAGSDAIRYLHLGNPEAIIIADGFLAESASRSMKSMVDRALAAPVSKRRL
jgi:hypothetical protein